MTIGEEILALAAALTRAEEEERDALARLAAAQEAALRRALRDGVTAEECEDAFVCAGAFLAAAALESARAGGEELSSLRAGEVSVTKRAAGESGRRIRALEAQAWALMRPYTKDGGFCFCTTQG